MKLKIKAPDPNECALAKQPMYELQDLLKGITPETLHGEVDFGPPKGNEFDW